MNTAIVKFYANGAYTFNDSQEKIDYSTRASAVWISTDSGWKMVHANWAPFGGSAVKLYRDRIYYRFYIGISNG